MLLATAVTHGEDTVEPQRLHTVHWGGHTMPGAPYELLGPSAGQRHACVFRSRWLSVADLGPANLFCVDLQVT